MHTALQSIVQALNRGGCDSIDDERFVAAMRQLAGYSKVIEEALTGTVERLNQNPRFVSGSRHLIAEVKKLLPSMRESLQVLVSKLRLGTAESRIFQTGVYGRGPLHNGTYTEIEVKAPSIEWHGFIDLLTLADSRCEIVDFKSGQPVPEHEEQLKIYSLLWARDAELNPDGRAADSLTLSYSNREVIFKPLTKQELDLLEQELVRRTTEAITALRQDVPLAVPSPNNCRFCSVRQICDEYWTTATQARLAQDMREEGLIVGPVIDVEVKIIEQQSPAVWRAVVVVSQQLTAGSVVLIQVLDEHQSVKTTIQPDRRVRLIDVLLVHQDEDKSFEPLITLGKYSEIFVVQ